MPIILSEANLSQFTNEEVLMLALRELANPSNYEPYEKDYGNGAVVERMPYIGRNPRQYAQDVITFINARMVEKVDTTDLKSVSDSCAGSSPAASTTITRECLYSKCKKVFKVHNPIKLNNGEYTGAVYCSRECCKTDRNIDG